MKKVLSLVLAMAMLLTMSSLAVAEAGVFTGVGDSKIGGAGSIEVAVTVDENGVVKALKEGTTSIIVKYGDQEAKCIVRCGWY